VDLAQGRGASAEKQTAGEAQGEEVEQYQLVGRSVAPARGGAESQDERGERRDGERCTL